MTRVLERLAEEGQLLHDLPAAMEFICQRQDDGPSMMALHTGPSRAGDIERQIVPGARGPEKLTVTLLRA